MPFRRWPGVEMLVGMAVAVAFDLEETGLGVGERGVVKGCGAEVEVAAGGVVEGRETEVVNVRLGIEDRKDETPLRRQERQIIVVVDWDWDWDCEVVCRWS